jgi:hypothetical protein
MVKSELIENLAEQGSRFNPTYHLNQQLVGVEN